MDMTSRSGPPTLVPDEELAAEAMAADPDPSLDGALPLARMVGAEAPAALPEWYMPTPMAGARLSGWRRGVVYAFIAALLTIEAFGLCTTFGPNF
jgi:hypothetical protein